MAKRASMKGSGAAMFFGTSDQEQGVHMVPVNNIIANPLNPRKHFDEKALEQLANSIKENGIIQPLVVRPAGEKYMLIAGERRWRAAQIANQVHVPVVVREIEPAQEQEFMLIENVQREDLDPLEEAHGYKQLLEQYGYTQQQLAQRIGKTQGHISNRLRLLELPESCKEDILNGRITATHAKHILSLKDYPELMGQAIEQAREGITVDLLNERIYNMVSRVTGVAVATEKSTNLPLYGVKKAEFDTNECKDCKKTITAGHSQYGKHTFCMDRQCSEVKAMFHQKMQVAQVIRDHQEEERIDVTKLGHQSYEYMINEFVVDECANCENHKKSQGGSDICLDPSCYRKIKTQVTREKNKQQKEKEQAFQQRARDAAQTVAFHGLTKREMIVMLVAMVKALDRSYRQENSITVKNYLNHRFGLELPQSSWEMTHNGWPGTLKLLEGLNEWQMRTMLIEWPLVALGESDQCVAWYINEAKKQ